ncbi:MAG: S41 family peptidase, partial [Anaerolineaceae bacterium]|nr:S41 family peptidase [Anaerolineaceae bacterium]
TVLAVLLLGYALGSAHRSLDAQARPRLSADEQRLFDSFWQVWEHIRVDYADPQRKVPEASVLVDGAIRGMTDALGDEHSGYLNAQQYPLMQEEHAGAVNGIGAVVEREDTSGQQQIAWVLPGTPAEAAGLAAGDVFLQVDGVDVREASQLELAALVRGPVGTLVELQMRRGEDRLDFIITRARIDIPNVEARRVQATEIGYVQLQHFNGNARQQMEEALDAMDAGSLTGLVLDLRNNPGGLLDSAIAIASAFIEDGPLLIEYSGNGQKVHRADGSFVGLTLPMVVLVNEQSASASELVAGALRDRGRAIIIGEPTFGKGTMQNLFSLDNGGGLQLTVARWLTPEGHWIHESGIMPDIHVEQSLQPPTQEEDPQLQAAIEYLQASAAVHAN